MMAKAIEVAINTVMRGHVYKFNNVIKQQKVGGAIGLELTGEIAGVFMCWWDRCLKKRLAEEGIKLAVYKRYIDDINIAAYHQEENQSNEGKEMDKVVIERIQAIGNQIHKSIQLEADYPSRYEEGKVPILDVRVWVDSNNKILYEYYAKQVSSKSVVDFRSAMSLRDKRTVLTQDILRIILRCSPLLPISTVVKHIDEYMLRLQFSGYCKRLREDILKSALNAYKKIKEDVEKGRRPLYRAKQWKQEERYKVKRRKKKEWFKTNRGKRVNTDRDKGKGQYKSVLFVQPTRGSKLKKLYEKAIQNGKCRVKVVERAGESLKKKL